jgi:hypothetical protein
MNVRMTRAVEIPAQARPTASPQASVEDRKGPLVSVGPNRLVTPLLSSAMVLVSTAIAYPHPRHTRRSASQRVRPARRRGPELTGAFPADVDPARLPSTFAQVTALRPKAEMVDSSNPFWIPPPGTREGPRPAFPQVRGPLSTWWQVKDSNLRSFRDGFTVHSHWPLGQPALVRMEG